MKHQSIRELAIVLPIGSWLAGCGDGRNNPQQQQAVSYASREPGSHATPTNDSSLQLLEQDPETRLAFLQSYVVRAGHHCIRVTRGVFEGGLDGTDEWRINCAGTGAWQLLFKPYETPEVEHCRNSNCD
ncbi:MAG: hypothetical protein ACJ8FS_02815 [Sphingomicrobium sp.]